jgi:hypothetical protein
VAFMAGVPELRLSWWLERGKLRDLLGMLKMISKAM